MSATEETPPTIDVHRFTYPTSRGRYRGATVYAGKATTERVVPPAGEDYAFDVTRWPTRVQVTVSPTGRSVRIHVNGVEYKPGGAP